MVLLLAARRTGEATRARIRAAVEAEPGIHVSELVKRVDLAWGTIAYHLRILERAQLLHIEKGERERRAFPAGIPADQRKWLEALRTDQAAEVMRILMQNEPLTVRALSRRMGRSPKAVRRQLARLAEVGLLEQQGEIRPLYKPNRSAGLDEDVEYHHAHRLLGQDNPLDRRIVEALVRRPRRYGELKELLDGKRDHNLTMALDRLRRDGLVDQRVDASTKPPTKSYELTNLGALVVLRMHEMIPAQVSAQTLLRGKISGRPSQA